MLRFRLMREESGAPASYVDLSTMLTLVEYVPRQLDRKTETVNNRPVRSKEGLAEETARFHSLCNVHAAKDMFEAWLDRAREWASAERRDMAVKLQVQDPNRHAANEWYTAEVFGGRVEIEDSNGRIVKVVWQRGAWHGASTLLNLQHATASGTVLRLNQYTSDTTSNWAIVTPPSGTLPAATHIRVRNVSREPTLRHVYLAWFERPTLHSFPGRTALAPATEPAPNSASGRITLIGQGSGVTWRIPHQRTSELSGVYSVFTVGRMAGAVQVFANATGSASAWQVALQPRNVGHTRDTPDNALASLGLLSLPVGGYRAPRRADTMVRITTGSASRLDYMMLLPHNYRKLSPFIDVQAGACFDDNGILDEVTTDFADTNGTYRTAADASGTRISILPASLLPSPKQQQVSVFAATANGLVPIQTELDLQIRVEPRWGILP